MIGVFDSGQGGLTVLRALVARFPRQSFLYLGDHANAPYGERPADEVIALTEAALARLFGLGCRLVLLGCNTATAVAARRLQQHWLADSGWRAKGHNVLGIIAPTVEAATQTPWAVVTPQYPQKYNSDTIAVFATTRTIASHVYAEEIAKRCPRVTVVQQACPGLAGAIERAAPATEIDALVAVAAAAVLAGLGSTRLDRAILGCTHYPLVEDVFGRHLPASTRLLSQPEIVADSLDDYLARHPEFAGGEGEGVALRVRLLTSGDPIPANRGAQLFWPAAPTFEPLR